MSDGSNFRQIKCDKKVSVDPVRICDDVTCEMTSDDFFSRNKETFDIIFIDGHHHSEYVCRDINNSLKVLNDNGTIVVHDCFPYSRQASCRLEDYIEGDPWCGDGFKVIHSIVADYSDAVDCFVLNTDWGVGLLNKVSRSAIEIEFDSNYTWEQMISNPGREINLVNQQALKPVLNQRSAGKYKKILNRFLIKHYY